MIGAGASKELGLPLGDELKTRIAKAISFKHSNYEIAGGDEHVRDSILTAIRESKFLKHEVFGCCKKICTALQFAISIDNYLEVNEGDKEIEFCSKIAIASAIGQAENDSGLFEGYVNSRSGQGYKKEVNYDTISKTWFMPLIRFLTENVKSGSVGSVFNSVKFIILITTDALSNFFFWPSSAIIIYQLKRQDKFFLGLRFITYMEAMVYFLGKSVKLIPV